MTEQTTAVVTGAGGDIGRAIAASLSRAYRVIVADIDLAAAAKTASSLNATALRCDITDPASVASFAKAVRAVGVVSVLVNNAGAAQDVSLHALTEAGLAADLNLNLAGAIRMFKAFEADLIANNGCLINIASVNGIGTFGHPAYSAAKAGLIQFTRAVAVEYGRYGLRANTVAPGTVQTQAWKARQSANPDVFAEAKRWYPLDRVARPEDVAEAVAFLVAAQAITGVCLPVDCGLLAGQSALAATFTQSADFTR